MSAWVNLFQKEYRMTRNATFISLAILLAGGLWLLYLSYRHNIAVLLIPAGFLLVFLLFYPAMYILRSLAWEWKVSPHLWLHCPQPAWMLLSAKLAHPLLHSLAVMALTAVLLTLGISISPHPEQLGLNTADLLPLLFEAGFYAAAVIVAASIYISAWATMISVATVLAGQFLGRFRWVAGVAVFLAATAGVGRLEETGAYALITRWGMVNININHFSPFPRMDINIGQFYAGEVLFYLLLTAALFALAAWLIDRKVEV